ncbi:SusC/RagA family TonB-linked outer membrane protein [Pedobacter frigoris]|uniref:SusC/RagA family TonB-linked outer membrane protein n=1 Tax=Pedobacter frigoris TaxID=2571272 RepID=UPI0029304A46|nr:SusC/RagA family TonB-linked outer membrane protein [Pedobacter frigoris]
MIRIITVGIYVGLLSIFGLTKVQAKTISTANLNYSILLRQDTDDTSKTTLDTIVMKDRRTLVKGIRDSLHVKVAALSPNISVQQMLKGNIAGLYVQETSGESGSGQSMIIRGLSAPVFNKNEIYNQQPTVYVNGVPMIKENSFVFDIQKYDFNRIGPATNLLAGIDISNINSIEVIKDPAELAKLGPNAANGAIWITTKAAKSGYRDLSVNSYFGMVQESNISQINAEYENTFRKPFYQKYATQSDYLNYVGYLRDSTNLDYYGPARWSDLYYKNRAIHSVDLGLTGGSERANFRFFGSATTNAGNADDTDLNRYHASFQINMAPFSWITISSMANVGRMDRDRNRNLRDRFAETRYIPDLYNPLSPNKNTYQLFLDEYDKAIDDNRTTQAQGYLSLKFNLKPFNFVSTLNFDYNEGVRDVFYPTTLMGGNNYVSNYFGYNQRLMVNNALNYTKDLGTAHKFYFEVGQSIQDDIYKYNYANAYNGPNDFIKINVVNGTVGADDYLTPNTYLVYRYTDRIQTRLISFYASAKYNYKDLLTVNALVRDDASSTSQPGSRWFVAPAANASWNMKNQFLKSNKVINKLNFDLSWSRIGKPFSDDRYAAGPQYRVSAGWALEPTIPGYNGVATISRPYTSGWVGYDIRSPYTDQLNIGLDASFLDNRIGASATFYIKDDNRMILNTPIPAETGYASQFSSGLDVRNTGIDLGLDANIVKGDKFNWQTGLNVNLNRNKLKALPGGLNELIVADRKLKIGESIDKFWLYQNNGIYNSDNEVEVNPADNKKLTFEGTTLKAGDPRWKDINGDYVIDNDDKVLTGNSMPKISGGWSNDLKYGNFNLNINVVFALGHKALNQSVSQQYDFINRESANDINSVREIFSWQENADLSKYAIYNPWSSVVPYRLEQDIFLENASYAKLRTVSIGYDLSSLNFFKSKTNIKRAYLYLTGNNLLTFTSFSGSDPELVEYNGIYTGYGLAIPRTYTLGIKVDL